MAPVTGCTKDGDSKRPNMCGRVVAVVVVLVVTVVVVVVVVVVVGLEFIVRRGCSVQLPMCKKENKKQLLFKLY